MSKAFGLDLETAGRERPFAVRLSAFRTPVSGLRVPHCRSPIPAVLCVRLGETGVLCVRLGETGVLCIRHGETGVLCVSAVNCRAVRRCLSPVSVFLCALCPSTSLRAALVRPRGSRRGAWSRGCVSALKAVPFAVAFPQSPSFSASSAISALKTVQFPCQKRGKKVINIKVCT